MYDKDTSIFLGLYGKDTSVFLGLYDKICRINNINFQNIKSVVYLKSLFQKICL